MPYSNKKVKLKKGTIHMSGDEKLRRMTGDKERYNNPATVTLKLAKKKITKNIDIWDKA